MKKLIIVLAIVVSATIANASAVTWGLLSGNTLDATKVDAGTMYLVYASDASKIDFGVLSSATSYGADTIAKLGFDKTIATFDYSASKISQKDTITPSSTGLTAGNKGMYMICIDDGGKDIAYSGPKSINVQASAMTVNAGVLSSTFTYARASEGPEPIPEPTSGLLLLLGVAGLALRRKQK